MSKRKNRLKGPKKHDPSLKSRKYIVEIKKAWQRRAEDFYAIGVLLNKAKKKVPSKGFKVWIEGNLPFSYSTANNYMNVAKKFDGPDDVKFFSAKSLILMSREKFPVGLRTKIIASAKEDKRWTEELIRERWNDFKSKKVRKSSASSSKNGGKVGRSQPAKMAEQSAPVEVESSKSQSPLAELKSATKRFVGAFNDKKVPAKKREKCLKIIKLVRKKLLSIQRALEE